MTAWDPIKDGGYRDEDDLRAAFERRAKRRLESIDDPEIIEAAEAAAERRSKTPTRSLLELSLASVFARVNPAQGAAVTETVAAFNSNPDSDLVSACLVPSDEGAAEFCGGFPPDAAIVEFIYRDPRDPVVVADRETPGREVTVYGVHGEVLDSRDFG